MQRRKQNGSITSFNSKWYLRFWQTLTIDGALTRKRATVYLGPVTTRGKKPPDAIVKAAEDHMRTVGDCTIPVERIIGFGDFVVDIYRPWVKLNRRPSTYKGYRDVWEDHIKPASSRDRVSLKDVRTFTVQRWLDHIGKGTLSRNSLKRIQSTLSGVFRHAKQQGYYDGVNPVQDTGVNPRAPEPAETFDYSLEDIHAILAVLPEPAATAFALASFTGLRRGEIEGLEWPDYHDGALHVSRSVWNGRVTAAKTKASCAAVPVIRQLAERLELHRLRCGNPQGGLPIFANTLGRRESINNLLSRHILPALNRCGVCRLPDGVRHLKQEHDYRRDASLPAWRGWHACRRGLGSNLYRLGAPDKVIQLILRHANVNTTLGFYVKPSGPDVVAAMGKFEKSLDEQTAAHAAQDCYGTVKPGSGATPESVN
jgi:integrase